jgi:DNA-binding XRE family transcriptional regulator
MTGQKLVLAGWLAVALGIALLVLGSPSLGAELNVLPLSLTNAGTPFDAAELQLSSNVTQTMTSTVNLTGSLKVATAIAKYFSVTVDSVVAMHNAGHGYGEIVKALSLAQMLGNKTDDIFKLRGENQGWGKILKSLAVSKWDTSLGKLMHAANSKHESVDGNAPGKSGEHRQDQKGKDKGSGGKDDDDKGDDKGNNGKGNNDNGDDKGNNGKGNEKGNNGKGNGGK